jgi:hypothetical protein
MDISPGIQAGVSSPLIVGNTSGQNSFLEHMIIPFPLLDACEEWYARAFSPDTQRHIRDIRRYAAAALLTPTQPRDIGFEVKARAILADYRQVAEPVGKETLLRRGDLLVRNLPEGEVPDLARSVFVVRFLQEGGSGGLKGSQPVVRGFWLGEPNPVATEDLSAIPGNFRRVIIEGDDQYDRIVRHLAAACQESALPFTCSRAGYPHDPVMKIDFGGFSLNYRPMERHFGFSADQAEEGLLLTFGEDGYPLETAAVSSGNREVIRWQGLPLIDIRFIRDQEQLLIILDDDFLSALRNTGIIPEEPERISKTLQFCFISKSEAKEGGLMG